MKVHFKKAAKKGFSLVELLVVIAVIGIMAAIAIPMISNINDKSRDAKDRRNAQSIASMAAAATAAGHTWGESASKETIVAAITSTNGIKIDAEGSFKDTVFRVPNLSTQDIGATDDAGAKRYLAFDSASGQLIYNSGFAATVTPPPVED